MKPGKDFKKNTWEESIKAWRILVVRACGGFRRNNTMTGAVRSRIPVQELTCFCLSKAGEYVPFYVAQLIIIFVNISPFPLFLF